MKNKLILLLACFFIHLNTWANNDSTIISSQLKNVTVYKTGAEMTHTTSTYLKQGNNELIIDNISNQLDINSIQIKTESAVTIMGIEFTNNYLISPENTPRLQFLQDSLERIEKNIDDVDILIGNTTDLLDVLKTNKDIKGEQTGLSVAELMKMMDYYKTKSLELQTYIAKLNARKEKMLENKLKIQEQVTEEEKKNISTAGRLILQLYVATPAKYNFTVSYITQNAYWTPYYDVRVDDIKNPVKLVYKAKIVQTTGIDWKQVKLSLSTSLPSQWSDAPIFKQWFLSYVNPVAIMDRRFKNNNYASNSISANSLDEVVVTGYGTAKTENQISIRGTSSVNSTPPLYVVNGNIMNADEYNKINPASIKNIQVLKDASATAIYGAAAANGVIIVTLKDGLEDYISVSDNTLDISFDIDMPYDVPTNGKEQTATLKTIDIPAIYNHYAAPKLDKDPYLLAQIPQWTKYNLLPGEANIIVENTYIGKSFIDPNSTSDTLNLTLGRDKRVIVKREKIMDFSSVKFLGSNKVQKFTYEITVKNTKKDTVNMILKDQFPLSTDNDIQVELLETANADVNNDLGILNWRVSLAAGETKKFRFVYSIKYPKNKEVR